MWLRLDDYDGSLSFQMVELKEMMRHEETNHAVDWWSIDDLIWWLCDWQVIKL